MIFPIIRRIPLALLRSTKGFSIFTRRNPTKNRLVSPQGFFNRWLAKDTKQAAPLPSGGQNAPQTPKLSGVAMFIAFSTGLSTAIAYYLYKASRPAEVTWPVLQDLLTRGEVRAIQVSRSKNAAFVFLYLPYRVNGRAVFTLRIPLVNATAHDFENQIREYEDKIGIPKTDRIPVTFSHGMNTDDYIMTAILTSAVVATVLAIWVRKNVPPDLPPKEGLQVALRKLAFFPNQQLQTKMPKFQEQPPPPPPPPPKAPLPRDDPSVGGNFTGGNFGSGLPFLDGFPGMGEPQPVTTDTTFDDVAGMHAAKEEVVEFVSYLRNPDKYRALGAKLPKGALLLGPPGTGKTLLVRALAHEADVPFFSVAGSEFIEVIGGLGASRIRKLFAAARQHSPAIIFIDEIDSVGRKRSAADAGGGGGGVQEMEQTLNQLLVEMDGMETSEGTIVFAATNRADLLDQALLRAGRFDRHIFIDLPNLAERKELLDMYLGKYKLSKSVDKTKLRDRLATWTSGMSGADIARLCNEAALITARGENPEDGVQVAQFESALERILAGAAKKSHKGILTALERRVAAAQEAGRALVAFLLPSTGLIPFRVSIVPRVSTTTGESSLGFTQFVPEERLLLNSEDIADRLTVLLAGRAAENVMFNASSDASERYLKRATELAYKEVREWGMSKAVGNLSFGDPAQNPYSVEPYSKRTASMIDLEAQRFIAEASKRAMAMIRKHEAPLRRIVEALLEKEVLSSDELRTLIRGEGQESQQPSVA